MRSFATLLTALTLPLYAFSAHHGEHVRRHADVAVRARGDIAERGGARLTYYDITTGTTACGGNYNAGAFVVALNIEQWNGGSHCGDSISVTYNGATVQVTIVDLCPGCPSQGLDCTEGVFKALAGSLGPGVIYGDWSFGGAAPAPAAAPKEKPTPTTPKYTPPKTTSTPAYTPPPPKTTSTPPPPPSSSSTSTPKPSNLASPSNPPSQSHSSSTPSSTSTSSVPSYSAVPSSGLAQPAGTIADNGETENLETLFNLIIALGALVVPS